MRKVYAVLFPLLFSVSLCSQEKDVPPVSHDDLRRAEEKIRRDIRETGRKTAEEIRREREVAKVEREAAAAKAAAALKSAENNLARISEEQRRSLEAKQQLNTRISIIVGAVIVLVLIGGFYYLSGAKPKKNILFSQLGVETPELINPDAEFLRVFAERNGSPKKIPIIITLQDGHRVNCIAEMREGLPPLVHFEGMKDPAAWDKRRQSAAKIVSSRN